MPAGRRCSCMYYIDLLRLREMRDGIDYSGTYGYARMQLGAGNGASW